MPKSSQFKRNLQSSFTTQHRRLSGRMDELVALGRMLNAEEALTPFFSRVTLPRLQIASTPKFGSLLIRLQERGVLSAEAGTEHARD